MGIPRIDTGPMTVEEFYAFTDSRPDDEKWELIDGEPVLNATPSFLHQRIVGNIHSHRWPSKSKDGAIGRPSWASASEFPAPGFRVLTSVYGPKPLHMEIR